MNKANAFHLIAFLSLIAGLVVWIVSAMTSASIRASPYLTVSSDGNSSLSLSLDQGQLAYEHGFKGETIKSWTVDSSWIWEPGYHNDARLFAPLEIDVDRFPKVLRIGLPLWTLAPGWIVLWLSICYLRHCRKNGKTRDARQPATTSQVESELDPPVPPHHRC